MECKEKIISSSIDRCVVENEYPKISSDLKDDKNKQKKKKLFIIQFCNTKKNVIHGVVSESNLSFPPANQTDQRHVMFFKGHEKTSATILHRSENKDELMTEFQKLKMACFDCAFDDVNEFEESTTKEQWLLILYTCGIYNVTYAIVNSRDTVSKYADDLFTYTTYRTITHKVIILEKSTNLEKLLISLDRIKQLPSLITFPLDIDVNGEGAMPPLGFQSLCESNDEPEKQARLKRMKNYFLRSRKIDEKKIKEFRRLIEIRREKLTLLMTRCNMN